MATNEAIPYWDNGDYLTGECTAAVTGKRFLSVSGLGTGVNGAMPKVAHSAAAAPVFGISCFDAPAGGIVNIAHAPTIVMPVTVGAGGVTAGDGVVPDATGKAVKGGSGVQCAGIALANAGAGLDCPVDRSVRIANP